MSSGAGFGANEVMDALEARAQRQLNLMRDLGEKMSAVLVRETSSDGAVTVEVDGNGALVDLRLSGAVSSMKPADLEQAVVDTAARAAQLAFAQRGDLVDAFNKEAAETLQSGASGPNGQP